MSARLRYFTELISFRPDCNVLIDGDEKIQGIGVGSDLSNVKLPSSYGHVKTHG